MANTYNSQRLRFVHDDKLYGNLEEIKAYVLSYSFLQNRPHVYAEPMVFKYGEDETDPNIVLVIGAYGNGVEANPDKNKVLLIDFKGLEKEITRVAESIDGTASDIETLKSLIEKLKNACGFNTDFEYETDSEDEILKIANSLVEADKALSNAIINLTSQYEEHVAKSKFNPQETTSIVWNVEEGDVENGTVVTAELKLPEAMDLMARRGTEETENSLEILNDGHSGHEGLFLNVTVKTEDGKAILWVNNKSYDISSDGKYIANARYDFETESIILEYNNGDEPITVKVEDLINEWKVLDEDAQYSNGVVLMRERVPAGPKDNNQYQDILTAKIHLADDDLNLVEVLNDNANNRYGLFVSRQPIDDETVRATAAETVLDKKIDDTKEDLQNMSSSIDARINAESTTREEADTALENKIDDLITKFGNVTGEDAIVVDDENKKITLKLDTNGYDSTKVLSQSSNGLAINFGIGKIKTKNSAGGEEVSLVIMDADGNPWGQPISVSEFIQDGILKSVEIVDGVLILHFDTRTGQSGDAKVDLKDFIKPYTNGDGIKVNNEDTTINIELHPNNENEFLTVNNNGLKLSGVRDAINATVQAAAESETAARTEAYEELKTKIAEVEVASNTEVKVKDGDTYTSHYLTVEKPETSDGHPRYTLQLTDVASEASLNALSGETKTVKEKVENLSAETAMRDVELQSNIDAEQARAEQAEAKATTEVEKDTELNTTNHLKISKSYGENVQAVYTIGLFDVASENALNEEVSRATGEETRIEGKVDAEVSRATGEEAKIREELAAAKQEAQTKVVLDSGYDPDKHMFLTMADTGDTYGQFVYTIGVKDVASATGLSDEISRATGEEGRIEGRLNDEIKRSTEKDDDHDAHLTTLDEGLAAEAKTREDKDAELEAALNAEIDRAIKAEQKAFVSSENTSTIEIIPKYMNDTEKVITANVKVFEDDNNIIKSGIGGIYANVTLEYVSTENKLIFKNGTAGSKEISLSDHTLVQSAYYNSEKKAIILTVVYDNGTKDIELPVSDLVNSITDVNDNLTARIEELKTKDSEIDSQISTIFETLTSGDTDLTLTKSDLETTKASLTELTAKFEKEVSDRQDGDKTLTDNLNALVQTVVQNKADAGQTLTEVKAELNSSIAKLQEAVTEEKTAREKDVKRLDDAIVEEVKDREKAVNDLKEIVTSNSNNIASLQSTVSNLSEALATETATREEVDNAIKESVENAKTTMNASLETAKSTLATSIESTKSDLQSQIISIDSKLTGTINSAKAELTAQMGTLQGTLETKIESAVNSAKTDLGKDISDNGTKIAQLQSDLSSARDRITVLEQSNILLTKDNSDIKAQITTMESRLRQLEADFQKLYNDGYTS